MQINKDLISLYKEWETSVLEPFVIAKQQDMQQYSRPFYTGVSDAFDADKKTALIIGQEANNFCRYNDDWPMIDIQAWCINYFERQVYGTKHEGYAYNRSAFWAFFRRLSQFNLIWTNLDRLHQYNDVGKTISLTTDDEKSLNKPFGQKNKSLLLQEIELMNPDCIIFITGPRYMYSMCEHFTIPQNTLNPYKPTHRRVCVNISETICTHNPLVLWTYHPTHLRKANVFDTCIDEIQACWDQHIQHK